MPYQQDPVVVDDPWNLDDCPNRDVAVVIDGTEIPTTEVETSVGSDGVADEQYLTKVHFPAEKDGQSVLDEIVQFDPERQSAYSVGYVFYRNPLSDSWYVAHKGFVRGVGSTSKNGEAKLWIDSPANLLTGIPVSIKLDQASVEFVFNFARDKIANSTIFEDVEVVASNIEGRVPLDQSKDDIVLEVGEAFFDALPGGGPSGQRKFRPNRDTLADVLRWFVDLVGGRFYFSVGTEGQLLLVFEEEPRQFTFVGDDVDETGVNVSILENNAIQEIQPYNSITVWGASGHTVEGHTVKGLLDTNYPIATATYDPLVERTGQALRPSVVNTDVTSMEAAEKVAKKELVNLLSSDGEGDIFMRGVPMIMLKDKVRARPLCESETPNSGSNNPLDFQVEQITHKNVGGEAYKTRVNVSTFINYDKISVSSETNTNQ